jgi:hypothetical protein
MDIVCDSERILHPFRVVMNVITLAVTMAVAARFTQEHATWNSRSRRSKARTSGKQVTRALSGNNREKVHQGSKGQSHVEKNAAGRQAEN